MLVGEAEQVLPRLLGGEDIVTLSLPGLGYDGLVVRAIDMDVNVECSPRLDLVPRGGAPKRIG